MATPRAGAAPRARSGARSVLKSPLPPVLTSPAMEVPEYDLPEAAIAQHPAEPRDSARLLDATDESGAVAHRTIRDLLRVLKPGDVLVVNNSRVLAARL